MTSNDIHFFQDETWDNWWEFRDTSNIKQRINSRKEIGFQLCSAIINYKRIVAMTFSQSKINFEDLQLCHCSWKSMEMLELLIREIVAESFGKWLSKKSPKGYLTFKKTPKGDLCMRPQEAFRLEWFALDGYLISQKGFTSRLRRERDFSQAGAKARAQKTVNPGCIL